MALGRWLAAAAAVWALAGVVPAKAATFSYEDPQCADFSVTGAGPAYTLTCNLISTPACQLTAFPAKPTVGEPVTLVASCTGAPFGWLFTKGSSPVSQAPICGTTSSTCVETNPPPSAGTTLIYTVLGGNGRGRGPVATVAVTWQ